MPDAVVIGHSRNSAGGLVGKRCYASFYKAPASFYDAQLARHRLALQV